MIAKIYIFMKQVASCLMNIGIIYRRADKSQKALEYY